MTPIQVVVIILLFIAVYIEYRTALIPNILTFAGAAQLLLARLVIGPAEWYSYLIAGILAILSLVLVNYIISVLWGGRSAIGFGGIKLITMVAIASGIQLTLEIIALFLGFLVCHMTLYYYLNLRIKVVPGSPLIALSTLIIYFKNHFGLNLSLLDIAKFYSFDF